MHIEDDNVQMEHKSVKSGGMRAGVTFTEKEQSMIDRLKWSTGQYKSIQIDWLEN